MHQFRWQQICAHPQSLDDPGLLGQRGRQWAPLWKHQMLTCHVLAGRRQSLSGLQSCHTAQLHVSHRGGNSQVLLGGIHRL